MPTIPKIQKDGRALADAKAEQIALEKAHVAEFRSVSAVIDEEIMNRKKILKLSDLLTLYTDYLEKTSFPNPNFRSYKLKKKIENSDAYQGRLAFCHMGEFQSYILYNSCIDLDSAVRESYRLGTTDTLALVGTNMHQLILQAHRNAGEMKWPPTAQELCDSPNQVPSQVESFLCHVMTGKAVTSSSMVQRLIQSIGQDLCRATTNGSWKLPKHMLLCMILRHLFRSKKLITLLNRLGHCESYSFSLELDTALAEAVAEISSMLSNKIIRSPTAPAVFHSEFDNFDQLLNDMTGKSSVHTAHGIMLQDMEGTETGGMKPEVPTLPRRKQRSLRVKSQPPLDDCYVTRRNSPVLVINQREFPGADEAGQRSIRNQILRMLVRLCCEN